MTKRTMLAILSFTFVMISSCSQVIKPSKQTQVMSMSLLSNSAIKKSFETQVPLLYRKTLYIPYVYVIELSPIEQRQFASNAYQVFTNMANLPKDIYLSFMTYSVDYADKLVRNFYTNVIYQKAKSYISSNLLYIEDVFSVLYNVNLNEAIELVQEQYYFVQGSYIQRVFPAVKTKPSSLYLVIEVFCVVPLERFTSHYVNSIGYLLQYIESNEQLHREYGLAYRKLFGLPVEKYLVESSLEFSF